MRTAKRTGDRTLLRDVGAIAAAMMAVGASFGAMAVAAGLPVWSVVAMSTLLYAGGAQFMAVGLVATGSPVAAVFAGLLLNARHLPFGLALGDTLGRRRWHRLLGSHLMTDEATAFALTQPEGGSRRRAFWLAGVILFLAWNAGTVLGMLVGGAAGDPAVLGLDAAFPAGLLALLLPSLRDRKTRRVALTGAALAVLTTPLLPAGLPVLLALAGMAVLALPGNQAGGPDDGVVPDDTDARQSAPANADRPGAVAADVGGSENQPGGATGGRPARAVAPC